MDKFEIFKQLVEMDVYQMIETIDGKLLYNRVEGKHKKRIVGLDFYPCFNTQSNEYIYVARANKKVYVINVLEDAYDDYATLSKYYDRIITNNERNRK